MSEAVNKKDELRSVKLGLFFVKTNWLTSEWDWCSG